MAGTDPILRPLAFALLCTHPNKQLLILFPVVQSAALLLFLLPWVTFMLYLASSGEVKHARMMVKRMAKRKKEKNPKESN